MAYNFPKGKLGDVASVRSGYAFRSKDMGDYGLPIIKIKNIVPPTVDVSDVQRIPESIVKGDNRIAQFVLSAGDILIAMTGATVGKVGRMPNTSETYYLNQRVGKVFLESPQNADYDFLYYVLSQDTHTRMMFGIADGSAQANISGGQIEGLEIPVSPLPEQKTIAHILGTLDDKIELNRKMNKTLEEIARAIFTSWFVDFEFPNEKGKPHKSSGGEMIDSELGKIPKGWKVKNLDEIANFLNGLALQKFPPDGTNDLPVIKIAQLRVGNTTGADLASSKIPAGYVVDDGDIIFSWSGSLMIRIWCGGKGALNQHLFKVTSEKYPKWFYYLWTSAHLSTFQHIAEGKATTMGHIQRQHLTDAKVFVPDDRLLETATAQIKPLLGQLVLNAVQFRTLAALRDALLPKLLSGEIRIKNAEEFLKERGL